MIISARAQHRRLLRTIVRILRRFRPPSDGSPPRVPLDLLDELLTDLSAHFAEEEGPGGLYERLDGEPTLATDVARLRSDHVHLAAWGRVVRERAAWDDAPLEAAEHVSAFLRALGEHEAKEEQLIRKLMDQDRDDSGNREC
ncbi:MAG: hypothetical protein CMJ83_17880 [Planctomycetes bacterium]|nr:hypothetical protein [Planctomycetota bacterium]